MDLLPHPTLNPLSISHPLDFFPIYPSLTLHLFLYWVKNNAPPTSSKNKTTTMVASIQRRSFIRSACPKRHHKT